MEDAFMSIADGTASAKDAFRSMAADVIRQLYRVLVVQRMVGQLATATSAGSGIMGFIGSSLGITGAASGRSVNAGQPYMTGEHGRELFVPQSNGRVLSAAQTNNLGSNDGGITVIQNNTFQSGVTRSEVSALLPRMVEASKAAVLDAKRQGGSYGKGFA
jgi:hypothetical protein